MERDERKMDDQIERAKTEYKLDELLAEEQGRSLEDVKRDWNIKVRQWMKDFIKQNS
jgi:hypothetical protein